MMEDNKLLKLSLQFFGGDKTDEDFEDDFAEGEEDYEDYDDPEESDAEEDEGEENTDDSENAEDSNNEDPDDAEGNAKTADNDTDLISELRALGYVGNDLASLTKDMKTKREAKAAQDAKNESAATKAEGKKHIKSSNPGKGATGDGTGGITEKQVDHYVSITKESKESARARLAKHARLINGN